MYLRFPPDVKTAHGGIAISYYSTNFSVVVWPNGWGGKIMNFTPAFSLRCIPPHSKLPCVLSSFLFYRVILSIASINKIGLRLGLSLRELCLNLTLILLLNHYPSPNLTLNVTQILYFFENS